MFTNVLMVNRKEFDLIIQPENQNKSPVIYRDHCLGLESWCVRHVYKYVYQRLITIRKQLKRQGNTLIFIIT
jgi:protein prenyltransferase alpha subunit repeat containing protein 1